MDKLNLDIVWGGWTAITYILYAAQHFPFLVTIGWSAHLTYLTLMSMT